MGFNSFHNSVQNPAQRYYKWSAGHKEEVALPDGSKANKIKGVLTYWDKERQENVEVALPFRCCVLEQTRAISGYSPTPGEDISYYSNEAVDANEPLRVFRKDSSGSKEILRGPYSAIKEKLPQGARLQINLYIYNPETDQVERVNVQGSAMAAFIQATQKQRGGVYERMLMIKGSGEIKQTGSVQYEPPVFELAPTPYSDEELKKLSDLDVEVVEYLKYRREANIEALGTPAEEGVDQTPSVYQGEENQETGEAGDQIEMEEIPF